MIKINYNKENIQITTLNLEDVFSESQLPLHFTFVRQVNNKKLWDIRLMANSWATFPDTEMVDVIINDNTGKHLFTRKWNVLMEGSLIYQKLWNFCNNIENSKGLVIGTHNGEFGEWVPTALKEQSEMVLVEASKKQFEELCNNFKYNKRVSLMNELVTADGEDVLFYEGGLGYTNTILKRVIEYWETEPITESLRSSIKFSDLITPDINWVHMDVEGIDIQLIMSLSDEKLDQLGLIIYEYNNSGPEERVTIQNYLTEKGFTNYMEGGVGMAFKK